LDQIVDVIHPLAKLGWIIDWGFLKKSFGDVYNNVPGRPPLPTRLKASLAILKHIVVIMTLQPSSSSSQR
jgi:IS5 family transposase